MKLRSVLLAVLFPVVFCHGQEFTIYPNGLMYSDTTMQQLKFIVDSLNIKFRRCELNKSYYSKYQAKGHYVSLEKGNIKEARNDMKNNLPFSEFMKKYPGCTVDTNLLIVKFRYMNYDDKEVVTYNSIALDEKYEHEISIDNHPEVYGKKVQGTWIYDYWKGSNYTSESISAFYFDTEFEKKPLPEQYARMIQYSDCMVDTNMQVFKENAERTGRPFLNSDTSGKKASPSKVSKFMAYVIKNEIPGMPEYKGENYVQYQARYQAWDSLRIAHNDRYLSKQPKFRALLKEAVAEALEKGGSSDALEEYTARYYSKKAALELKRGRIVVGGCSQDDSPRIHAVNIAVLSAESVNWETFLRAHLDIMNDRFERASDGNYAWAARQTYIKELEELDINVTDLLLGISLRMEDEAKNHYYGRIGRLGRALSETKYAAEIESKMLGMIKDCTLDDYNRILIYYLFLNYNHYIEDAERKMKNEENLNAAVTELPEYLTGRMNIRE